ncbi:MAG TPA: DUF222 domain-containing protein [Streptosporangiaceae bacterium]|nr:DUF222 domain-containing protein [Streptosporangiaceae bacterium]
MTESGWDIPGVPRDAPSGGAAAGQPDAPSAPSAGPGAGARRGSRKRRPLSSASAVSGSSAGAFAPLADDVAASAASRLESPAQALALLSEALDYLTSADPAEWGEGLQADCLRALAVAESQQTAAHAKVLAAFSVPGGGLAGDGHRSPRVWLSWQTQATRFAAGQKVGWMHRLQGHPVIAAALAAGGISPSWGRQIGDWTDRLPAQVRDAADQELLAAAGSGAGLRDLFYIAEDQRREHAQPDKDDDGGFADRNLRLAVTFGGAGRLDGDLTARCAAAVQAVLDSLSKRAGPEDTRTAAQRQHDALEEAMLRLIAADMLPLRAGQPVRLELEVTLDQLLNGTCGPAGPVPALPATRSSPR